MLLNYQSKLYPIFRHSWTLQDHHTVLFYSQRIGNIFQHKMDRIGIFHIHRFRDLSTLHHWPIGIPHHLCVFLPRTRKVFLKKLSKVVLTLIHDYIFYFIILLFEYFSTKGDIFFHTFPSGIASTATTRKGSMEVTVFCIWYLIFHAITCFTLIIQIQLIFVKLKEVDIFCASRIVFTGVCVHI